VKVLGRPVSRAAADAHAREREAASCRLTQSGRKIALLDLVYPYVSYEGQGYARELRKILVTEASTRTHARA